MLAVIGLLVILNFLSFGLLFILFVRNRDFFNNIQGLAERVSVIEEMMVELAEAEAPVEDYRHVETFQEKTAMEDLPQEGLTKADAISTVADETPQIINIEQERSRQVLELAHLGLSPEAIAKASGYSNGEVRLILNLHRNGHSVR